MIGRVGNGVCAIGTELFVGVVVKSTGGTFCTRGYFSNKVAKARRFWYTGYAEVNR